MNCPVCESDLESKGFTIGESEATNHYYCPTCDVKYHQECPCEGTPRWYASIPMNRFPLKAWQNFLFQEWNSWGESIPDRASDVGYPPLTEREQNWFKVHGTSPQEE